MEQPTSAARLNILFDLIGDTSQTWKGKSKTVSEMDFSRPRSGCVGVVRGRQVGG